MHDRSHRDDVEVEEVGPLRMLVVLGADVATAGDGDRIVRDEQLVVHAPVDAIDVADRRQQTHREPRASVREGIEETHLDVGMRRVPGDALVLAAGVEVVDQQSDANAALAASRAARRSVRA